MAQLTLFGKTRDRRKPRKLMHVCDAGEGTKVHGEYLDHVLFECRRCSFRSDWQLERRIVARRGVPCPVCNPLDMPPLFIPLKGQFYDAFISGEKSIEYRRFGPRWNFETCVIGRSVTLSRGYGKQNRREGVVVKFEVSGDPCQTEAWRECYGPAHDDTRAACISIHLQHTGER